MTVQSQSVFETHNDSIQIAYGKEFAAADSTIPYRLVGSYEYLKAIQNINRLTAISSKSEIKVYDALIASQNEFSFYSGIATDYGLVSVDSLPDNERELIESTYKRQSLAWLLALARVEIGATISMYGFSNDPFGQVGMSNFGIREYTEILLDDLTTHLKAVKNDQGFQEAVYVRKPNSDTMAYLRRARLINDLLDKVMLSNNEELVIAAKPYSRGVSDYIKSIAKRIESASKPEWSLSFESTSPEKLAAKSGYSKTIRFVDRQRLTRCQRMTEAIFNNR